MPYNNNPIAPSKEVTGTVNLPLARTKKIINADDYISNCSNNAAFAITIATEQFLQYLVEQTHNVVKAERKPRRNIQYRDVANAVARHDNLEFLTDVVPRTTTYKVHKERVQRERKEVRDSLGVGQTTLGASGQVNGHHPQTEGAGPGVMGMTSPPQAPPPQDHAGPEVMEIDAVAGPAPSIPNGTVNGGHG